MNSRDMYSMTRKYDLVDIMYTLDAKNLYIKVYKLKNNP